MGTVERLGSEYKSVWERSPISVVQCLTRWETKVGMKHYSKYDTWTMTSPFAVSFAD
jgi:hypothetical protein